ncbi:Transmembrane protein 42 [Coemansia sp. RSA 1365]|nr:Transmembrane protein 42 [Coemansia sp. RSA 1365]
MLSPSSFFAILAGLFAALGSVSAKLTVNISASPFPDLVRQTLPRINTRALEVLSRILMAIGVGASNFFMWLFFTKALRFGDSTPRVMMLQTASNFAATAVCGVYLFGDALSMQWWAGASLIVIGLVILNSEKRVEPLARDSDSTHEKID